MMSIQPLNLIGPWITVFRGTTFLAAGPATYLCRCQHLVHDSRKEPPMYRRFGLLLATAFAIVLPVAAQEQPVVLDVPKEIAVPRGHELLFMMEAKGVQIY